MRYWTIVEPLNDSMTPVYETLSEQQILDQYFEYWSGRMKSVGKESEITPENCISDWCMIHWASETDQNGNLIKE